MSMPSFLGMWVAMMVPMMLPSLVPMLRRYRRAVGGIGEARPGLLTALAGAGYFFVWTALGLAAYAPALAQARPGGMACASACTAACVAPL